MASTLVSSCNTTAARAQRQAIAIIQHQRVMDEAAQVHKIAEQARRLTSAQPVFAGGDALPQGVRSRVHWERAS